MPREQSSFDSALTLVERAKRELVAATPSPRGVQSVSIADALVSFEELLRNADSQLELWQGPERVSRVCRAALDEALRRAERLRLEAPPLDYEALVAALADLIEPLEVFQDADGLSGST